LEGVSRASGPKLKTITASQPSITITLYSYLKCWHLLNNVLTLYFSHFVYFLLVSETPALKNRVPLLCLSDDVGLASSSHPPLPTLINPLFSKCCLYWGKRVEENAKK
jgi:hypothetical protein